VRYFLSIHYDDKYKKCVASIAKIVLCTIFFVISDTGDIEISIFLATIALKSLEGLITSSIFSLSYLIAGAFVIFTRTRPIIKREPATAYEILYEPVLSITKPPKMGPTTPAIPQPVNTRP